MPLLLSRGDRPWQVQNDQFQRITMSSEPNKVHNAWALSREPNKLSFPVSRTSACHTGKKRPQHWIGLCQPRINSLCSISIHLLLACYTHSRSRLLSHTRFKHTSTAWWYINLPQPLTFFWQHPLYANMIPSFRFLRILGLLLFIHSVFASERTPQRRSRLRLRSPPSTEAHSLVKRAAPSGWTLYVKSGNDGGGCYIDSQTRVLTGYSGSSTTNSLDSCLNTCRTKGFSYGGVENGNQCFVSSTPYRVNIDK